MTVLVQWRHFWNPETTGTTKPGKPKIDLVIIFAVNLREKQFRSYIITICVHCIFIKKYTQSLSAYTIYKTNHRKKKIDYYFRLKFKNSLKAEVEALLFSVNVNTKPCWELENKQTVDFSAKLPKQIFIRVKYLCIYISLCMCKYVHRANL